MSLVPWISQQSLLTLPNSVFSTDQEMKDDLTNGCFRSVGSDLTRTRELSVQKDPSRTPTSMREVWLKPDPLLNNLAPLRIELELEETVLPCCSRLHPWRVSCSGRGPERPWLPRRTPNKASEQGRPAWWGLHVNPPLGFSLPLIKISPPS